MDDLPKVESLDDIQYDIEGSKRFEDRQADHPWRTSAKVIARGDPGRDPDPTPGVGRRLLTGCEAATLRSYLTLLHLETCIRPIDDLSYLIGLASGILEAKLGRVLFDPARALAPVLVSTLREDRKLGKRAATLDAWAEGRAPTIIGIGLLVLLALRRACAGGKEQVIDFLDSHFAPGYRALLMTNGPGRTLDAIRERFRNPAYHGTAGFGEPEYREFAMLAVANRAFASWDLVGSESPDPDPRSGILHHHLHHWRPHPSERAPSERAEARPPVEAPLARLLGLAGSGSSHVIRLGHHRRQSPHETRSIRVEETTTDRSYRLGDPIRIEFEASRPCHFALLDVGTSGAVAVLWPNAWHPDSRIEGGRTYAIPGPDTPGPDFVLTGRPGRERLVAIATDDPLDAPLVDPDGAPFRSLTPDDLARLEDELGRADGRAVSICEFRVEE
jgi:hypothetical protein